MKKFVLIIVLLLSGIAQAGVVSGGGGMALVCRNTDSKIVGVKLLDLVEAEVRGILLVRLPNEVAYYRHFMSRWIESNGGKPAPEPDSALQEYIDRTLSEPLTTFTKPGEKLPRTSDYTGPMTYMGCNVEQFAVFLDLDRDRKKELEPKLYIDSEIWAAADAQSRMALLAHEFVYRNSRIVGGDSTSDNTRLVVGFLFSL